MGSEKNTSTNLGMYIPIAGKTTTPFFESYLIQSLGKIDSHDHSAGKGAALSQGSIVVSGNFDFNNFGLDKVNWVKYVNPVSYSTQPGSATTYFMNSDFYIKDGGGNVIQLTSGGGINSSLIGGFTGEYSSSGAFCVYDFSDNEYKFYESVGYMSTAIAGCFEIRDLNLNKDVYGVKLRTTGNVPATYTMTMPDAVPVADSLLQISTAGVWSYQSASTYVRTSGDQTIAGIKTFTSFSITPSSAPTTNYQVANKKYADDLDLTNVHLTGDESVAGIKTFGSFPVTPSSSPSSNYQVTNKKYVDDKSVPYDSLVTLFGTSLSDAFAPILRNASGVVVSSLRSDAMLPPKGNNAARPTPIEGMFRYNTEQKIFEGYSDGNWSSISGATTITDWASSTLYAVGNIVRHLEVSWRVIEKHTSSGSFDLSKVESFENGVKLYNQVSHGFTVLDVIRFNGTNWIKAKADIEDNLSDPPAVIWMAQGDYFVVVDTSRDLYVQGHGLTDDTYFLSAATAGALTATSPDLSNPIIGVLNADRLQLLNYRPSIISSEISIGTISNAEDVDITGRANGDTLIWNSSTGKYESGVITVDVQEAPIDGKQYVRKDAAWAEVVTTGGLSSLTASATLTINTIYSVDSTGDFTFIIPSGTTAGDTIQVKRNGFGGANVFTGAFRNSETALILRDWNYSLKLTWSASRSLWIYE